MKITKRQRKLERALQRQSDENPSGLSPAFQHSLQHGTEVRVAGSTYQGQVPQFAPVKGPLGEVIGYRKIAKGVPFVRVA